MLGLIYMIGGLPYWHIYEIQVPKLIVFGEVLFKYVLYNDELYRRITEDSLLKCLGSNQARVTMREVHEGICGTHQSAPKMKWLLRRADFYWPTMMADYF
jgi:hypothetical protein